MVPEDRKSNVNKQIMENLKRVYGEALKDDLPEEFEKLIERLKAEKEAKPDGR
jgi:hypothetical protein